MPRPPLHSPEAVLDAAEELLVDRGRASLTIRALAERSGASNGSIYHAFGSLETVAGAAWLRRAQRFLALQRSAVDDALASVDTQTEDKILNHLREIMQGRTTIFISHRVSTVRNADQIAVIHAGKIVELGTHDELLALNGYYCDLYNKQLLEEELAEVS